MPDVPQYICFILMPLNRPSTKCFQYKRLYDETTRPLTTTKLISCKVLGWVESLFNILFVLLAHDVIVTKKKNQKFLSSRSCKCRYQETVFHFFMLVMGCFINHIIYRPVPICIPTNRNCSLLGTSFDHLFQQIKTVFF